MSMEDKDKIKEVLKLLIEKLKKPENKELMDELLLNCGFFEVDGITDSAFVRLQRKVLRQKSRLYYKDIKDAQLKKELIDAHSQMLWYKTINELEKYFVYVNYQVENMLNYYIKNNDAFNKIRLDERKYCKTIFSSEKYTLTIDCSIYFFNKNNQQPNKISKIASLWAKLLFWSIDSGEPDFTVKQYNNLSAIIDIRNEQNHADYERNSNKCDYWYKQEDSFSFAFIEAIIKTIRNTII